MGNTLDSHLGFASAIILIDFAVDGEARRSSSALAVATQLRISTLKFKYFLLMCCVRGGVLRTAFRHLQIRNVDLPGRK
jgi:hypothetical protein